jgi:hypothetical protein
MQFARFAFLSIVAAGLVGCNSLSDITRPPGAAAADLRIINAAPGTAGVSVFQDNSTTPIATLDFRQSNAACLSIAAGSHVLHFRSAGTTLASTPAVNFEDNERYTAVLTSMGAVAKAMVLADDFSAGTGANGLRFINATATAGDVYVFAPGGELGTVAAPAVPNPAQLTGDVEYISRGTPQTQVRFFDVGVTTGTPRAEFTIPALASPRLGTIIFTDAVTNPAFLVNACP